MAYAGHAAAALDTAAALAEAQDRNSSFSALLALAMALAEQSSRSRVAQLLADAVPDIAGYEQAHVLLWEEGDARGFPCGLECPDPARDCATRLRTGRRPGRSAADDGRETHHRHRRVRSGAVAGSLPDRARFGGGGADRRPEHTVRRAGGGLGPRAVESDESVRERLSGVGSLAATALDSVALLDEVRHQALHDPLTELANSRLFEQQVSQALSLARRRGSRLAMLFIDLDEIQVRQRRPRAQGRRRAAPHGGGPTALDRPGRGHRGPDRR